MAGQIKDPGPGFGPGNKLIATTMLEWLAIGGHPSARAQAGRALGLGDTGLAEAPRWLPDHTIAEMIKAGGVDPSLARSVGHRLVAPDATGLRLYGLGLATPEKAYRRAQSLFPRETVGASWTVENIAARSAHMRFDPNPSQKELKESNGERGLPERVEESLCALRTGMLEAVPGLYGLLPAEVRESTCLARGGDACRYQIRWHATSTVGLRGGTALGLVLAGGYIAAAFWSGFSMGSVTVIGLASILLGAAVGRAFDLQRQLEAVAGARRGHLALFDQVDDALAAKLDALARADAKLEGEAPPSPVRRSYAAVGAGVGAGADPDEPSASPEQQQRIAAAAQHIHAAAGDLECWFEKQSPTEEDARGPGISDERGLVREIREWAARIGKLGSEDGEGPRSTLDLRALVGRAIATARPSLPRTAVIQVEAEEELHAIECEPVQVEHVVVQLVRNAVEASVELSETPEVFVHLRNVTRGVELVVEDRGVGIESSQVDEVFDPFFAERSAGAGGLGLTVCLRIIERHSGELRIEAGDRVGTRVTVMLPSAADPD